VEQLLQTRPLAHVKEECWLNFLKRSESSQNKKITVNFSVNSAFLAFSISSDILACVTAAKISIQSKRCRNIGNVEQRRSKQKKCTTSYHLPAATGLKVE
jgi:hypothetical protein